MRKQLKRLVTLGMVACLSVSSSMIAFAGQWKETGSQWKYQNDDGSYATSNWYWIDGNNDGVSECYYFNADGVMLANTITPDGYTVNDSGAWVIDGGVQTQSAVTSADNGSIKLKTDFIKQEFIDCYGKDKDYIINKYGEPYKFEDLGNDNYIILYIDQSFSLVNNKVDTISSALTGDPFMLFNYTKDEYSLDEFDTLLGAKSTYDGYWYIWHLNDTPSIELWYNSFMFYLYFQYE